MENDKNIYKWKPFDIKKKKNLFLFERILGAFIYFKMTLGKEKKNFVCVQRFDLVRLWCLSAKFFSRSMNPMYKYNTHMCTHINTHITINTRLK